MSGWRDIESAPKDGTYVLVALHEYNDKRKPFVMEVASFKGVVWGSECYPIHPPTHWMPLPEAPK